MKKFWLILLSLSLLLCLCACNSEQIISDDGRYVYDSDGNLILERMIDIDGTYIGKKEYQYKNGLRTVEKEYSASDVLAFITTFSYNTSGTLVSSNMEYYINGNVGSREVTEFNAAGLYARRSTFDENNIISYDLVYTYDENNQLSSIHNYNYANGKLHSSYVRDKDNLTIAEYQYDEQGLVSWHILYENKDGLPYKATDPDGSYKIYHYKDGNICTGYTVYEADGTFRYEEVYGQ